jgi:hypothetical protein
LPFVRVEAAWDATVGKDEAGAGGAGDHGSAESFSMSSRVRDVWVLNVWKSEMRSRAKNGWAVVQCWAEELE